MKKIVPIVIVCLLMTLVVIVSVTAQTPQPQARDPAFEQQVYDRLGAIDANAVPLFQEATRAMDAGDLAAAKQSYDQVLQLAPGFPDALRRQSYVEVELGNVDAGIQLARQALAAEDSPYNHAALAQALLAVRDKGLAVEALVHAKAAVGALPSDASANYILLMAGVIGGDVQAMRQATMTLVRISPEMPLGHYFAGLIASQDGQYEKAEQELLLAKKLGMPAEDVQQALDGGIASKARLYRSLRIGGYGLVTWLVSPVVLFLSGVLLSQLTLVAVRRVQPAGGYQMGTAERLVRTLYSIVIWITSLHFYISIPLLILVMVAVTGGTLYLYFVIGRIPLYLVLAVGLAALYILFSVIRSVLVRVEDREPGRSLPRDEARLLWGTAEEVAERVGTRPVQAIYITPGAEIVILERGGLLKKLRGAGQRCLILGLGALPGMTQGQFKAILAHEYGHFTNRDTAGGKLAVRVRASVYRMAYSMTTTGQAHWYNPVWWFVNGFYRVFLRITLGASRLQEILADRFAAMSYGVHDFVDGLTHIARQSLAFEMRASREIEQATEQRRGLLNLYTLSPLESNSQGELETKVQEMMSQPTSSYDSHPAVRERIELVKQLQASEKVGPGNQEPVWGLLPSADVLQSEMTAIVQKEIQEQL